jgi:hypothetical protein
MKKKLSLVSIFALLGTKAFADVVGPLDGIEGSLGVWYMHGSGIVFHPLEFVITMALCLVLLFVLAFVIIKIMKKKNISEKVIKYTKIAFLVLYIVLFISGAFVVFDRLN